jgi:hypothetical protein
MRSPYAAAAARERPGHRGATPQWTLTRVSLRGLALCARTSPTQLDSSAFPLRPQHKTLHVTRMLVHFPIRCMPADIAQIIVFHKERLVTNESGMRRCDRLSDRPSSGFTNRNRPGRNHLAFFFYFRSLIKFAALRERWMSRVAEFN